MAEIISPDNRENFLSQLKLKTNPSIVLEYNIVSMINELISDIREDKYVEEWNGEVNYEENDYHW